LPYWINRQDCLNDDLLTFSMTLTGPFTSYTLEVWAGQNCLDTPARVGTTATCWRVGSASPSSTPFAITIRAQDIVAHNLPSSTVPSNDQGVKPGTLADCTDTSITPPQDINLDFMLTTAATAVAQTGHQLFKTGIDIWGPAPPTNVSAASGETRLHLGWSISTSADVIAYDIYCDPPPGLVADSGATALGLFPPLPGLQPYAFDASVGTGGVVGAGGAGGVAGVGGAGGLVGTGGTTTTTGDGSIAPTAPIGPTCNSGSILKPGQPVDALAAYKCGSSTGKQATSGTVGGLVNSVEYTVAVAGVDSVRNQGVLSGQGCGTPEEITDFFELYKEAGGHGGGGLCSVVRPRSRAPGLGVALCTMAAALLLRRRSKR
jgi:hypothetical protein